MARAPVNYFKVELDDSIRDGQSINPFRSIPAPSRTSQHSLATRHSSIKEPIERESTQKSRMSHITSTSNVHESEEILREPDRLYMEETNELFQEGFKRLRSLADKEDNIMQHVLKMLPDKGRNTKSIMEGLIKEYKAKINEEKKVVERLIDLENSRTGYLDNLKEQAQKSEEEANKLRKYSEVRYDRQSGRFKKFEAESNESEMYDWIVDINLLTDVSREGWRVQFSPKFLSPETPINMTPDSENALSKATMIKPDIQGWEGALVSVVGLYDKGKTFVLNNITNKNLPSGKKVNTKGLSFKSVNVDSGTKLVLLDTAGSYSPVKVVNELSVLEKEATEIFILDVVLELSDYFICVVNDFTSLDQRYLNRISRTLQNSATKTFKEIIVVHNLKEVDTEEVLNHIWETQVTQIYGSGSQQTTKVAAINPQTKCLQEKDVVWFKTNYSRHVCLCNDDSDLGNTINPWTFSLLKYWLKAVLVPVNRPFSVMDSVITQATAKLSSYFRCNVDLEVEETEDPLVKHIRSNRPLQDTHNHIPNISIDSTGFVMAKPDSFIPHVDIVQGDKYVIFLDVPGLSREEIVLARQNSITIVKGNRRKPAGIEENTLEKNERKYGEFTMTFRIPDIYKRKWEEVTVQDGVLCIKYAKDEDETTIC